MNTDPTALRAINSRSDFLDAARALLQGLPETAVRDAYLADADFSPWPLGEPEVLDALTRWVRLPGRRLHLIGSRFDVLERDQSRFAQWRRRFAHALESLTPGDIEPSDMPCLLLLPGSTSLELLDRERWQGRLSTDRRALVAQRERVDAFVQRGEAAWPPTVLGL
jgi:hypothetical protein